MQDANGTNICHVGTAIIKTTFEICDLCNNSIHEDCCELANSLTICYACIGHTHINNQKDQSSNELENTVEQANTSAAIKCKLTIEQIEEKTTHKVQTNNPQHHDYHTINKNLAPDNNSLLHSIQDRVTYVVLVILIQNVKVPIQSRNLHLRRSILMKMPEMGNLH